MIRKQALIILMCLTFLLILVFAVQAQGSAQAFVTGYTIECNNFRILYNVNDPANGYYEARLTVYLQDGTAVGTTNGPGQSGFSYAVDVPISPAYPERTYFYIVIELYNGGTFINSTQTTPDPCYGNAGIGNPSTQGTSAPNSSQQPSSNWNGWTDGRLNPHQAEYYTIYCEHSSIKVYGKSNDPNNSNPALIERIPIELVERLSPNGGQILWNTGFLVPYRVTRSGDTITIEGNFGYLMPQSGSKSFSLTECQDRAAATPADPGYIRLPEIVFCIDYDGNGYTSPRCIRAAQNNPPGSTMAPPVGAKP